MSKVIEYVKASYKEITKEVTWPSMEALQQSTMIVLTSTLIITLIVWVMDYGSSMVLKSLYTIFK